MTETAERRLLDIAADIPPNLVEADDLLTRYGIWATRTGGGGRECGSAEGSYRSDSWQARESRRAPSPVRMGQIEALLCQRALARVPDLERVVLTILYIPRRESVETQLRLLRIPPRLSQDRHLRGLTMFRNLHAILSST